MKRLLLLSLGLLLPLLAAECGLRAFDAARGRAPLLATYHGLTVADAALGFRLRPSWTSLDGRERTNALGLRGAEVSVPKPAGTYRIVSIGGSTTYGYGLAEGEDFPSLLGAALTDSLGRVESINAGIPGHHSWHVLLRLRDEIPRLEPDVVVLFTGWNDLGVALTLGDSWRPRTRVASGVIEDPAGRPLWKRLALEAASYSALLRYAKEGYVRRRWADVSAVAAVGAESRALDPRVAASYEVNLREALEAIRAIGARPVIATQPFVLRAGHEEEDSAALRLVAPASLFADEAYWRAYAAWAGIVREVQARVAREAGVALVDCAAAFDRFAPADRARLFRDMIHLTLDGNREVAACLAPAVAPPLTGREGARPR